jgi:hypothetical protein
MDFDGQAAPKNVTKINYFKKLNENAMEKRMRLKHGQLSEDRVNVGPSAPGGLNLIRKMKILEQLGVLDHI